jgi:hypothetical protein
VLTHRANTVAQGRLLSQVASKYQSFNVTATPIRVAEIASSGCLETQAHIPASQSRPEETLQASILRVGGMSSSYRAGLGSVDAPKSQSRPMETAAIGSIETACLHGDHNANLTGKDRIAKSPRNADSDARTTESPSGDSASQNHECWNHAGRLPSRVYQCKHHFRKSPWNAHRRVGSQCRPRETSATIML